MNKFQKVSLLLLRLGMGWIMLYAGLAKIITPGWSAAPYLQNAQTFHNFFLWFTKPGILPITNFVNEWGLALLGVSLILGLFVRWSSLLGILLMLLYYFPVLTFPYIKPNSLVIDDHIAYALVLLLFAAMNAGRVWGLDSRMKK
jgi:thiosulfate dehydrogenase [quinone] large subunit